MLQIFDENLHFNCFDKKFNSSQKLFSLKDALFSIKYSKSSAGFPIFRDKK